MWDRTKQWLDDVPLRDPVEQRQAALVQVMLIGMIGVAGLGIPFSLIQGGSTAGQLGILICMPVLLCSISALVLLRRGNFKSAISIAIIGLMAGVALECLAGGLRVNGIQVSEFLIPITLAGLLAGRRTLIVTSVCSAALVIGTAALEAYDSPLVGFATSEGFSASSYVSAFILVVALLGLFLDRFGATLREALAAALAREQELERIRLSLEARTAELSSAKDALERELGVRAQTEAALAHERDLLHALMDNIPDMIYFKDTASRFVRINRAQARLLGIRTPAVAVGKTDCDFLPHEKASAIYAEEQQIIATSQPVLDRVEHSPAPGGQQRWFSTTKVPIVDQRGAVTGIVGISRDITARQEVERLKSEFISIVSHELRTPLTSIRGSLGLLAGGATGQLSTQAITMVDVARRNTERLMGLINDLLDMEKVEAGKLEFVLRPVELAPLIRQAIEMNAAYAAQFDVTIALADRQPGVCVVADSDRLMQVLTNLLSNAAKFSPIGGSVEVEIARCDQMIRILVTDHGPGIPAQFHDRIFSKFAQADSSDSRQKGGTGLGLSIAKAIVERLGGKIGFTTEIDVGTTFYVDLPEWGGPVDAERAPA